MNPLAFVRRRLRAGGPALAAAPDCGARGPALPVALAAALAAGLILAGCQRPVQLLRYEDLIAEGGFTSTLEGGEAEQLVCADETYFSRPLRAGEELSAAVEFGSGPRLAVSGCLAGAEAAAPASSLEVSVEALDGRALRVTIPAGAGERWWRREIDLAALAGAAGRIRVRGDLPPGEARVLLSEFVLAHGVPAPPPADGRRPPPQVLLISIDTLRADFVGALGGAAATPAIDRLAADGEIFTPHYAAGSWTKPSHAGLLTGEPGAVRGALGGDDPIHPGVVTLAERFRRAGFLTAGLVHDCVWLNPKFGFSRGFDSYRSVKWGTGPLVRAAVNWMAAHRDRPFFYFLHTFDVHSDFAVLPYEGPGVSRRTVAERFGVDGYGCRWGRCSTDYLEQLERGALEPLPGESEILRFLYGKGVEGVDAELGRLFADLRELSLYDGMLIAVTSDHGESLLDHGLTTHGSWWEQVIRVPLIVKWPGGENAGGRREIPSSALDVAPTLLAAAGVAAGDLPGADLRTRRPDRTVVVDAGWQAVIVGSLKGVAGAPGRGPQLYNLAADPGEARNLVAERPAEVELLVARLAEYQRNGERRLARLGLGEAPPAVALGAEERARLRALGYLGGGGTGAGDDGGGG